MRRAGVEPDQRVAEAIDLVEKKRDGYGRWPLENPHTGEVHFNLEIGDEKPSRWNTLRALTSIGLVFNARLTRMPPEGDWDYWTSR